MGHLAEVLIGHPQNGFGGQVVDRAVDGCSRCRRRCSSSGGPPRQDVHGGLAVIHHAAGLLQPAEDALIPVQTGGGVVVLRVVAILEDEVGDGLGVGLVAVE